MRSLRRTSPADRQGSGPHGGTIKENIRRFTEGLPLLNVVDKQKGY
jgi:hypothetical protein